MRCFKLLMLVFLPLVITDISAKIFICVDEQGKRHYSDKRCPKVPGKESQSYAMTSRVVAPKNVTAFTSVIKLAKESLALLMILEPNKRNYNQLYADISSAQIRHNKFIASPNRNRFRGYNPLGMALENRLIASLSTACREQGHMSICGAIEGNPWFSSQEADFYLARPTSSQLANKYCEKASRAHSGGVISAEMLNTFCRSNT